MNDQGWGSSQVLVPMGLQSSTLTFNLVTRREGAAQPAQDRTAS